MTNAASTKPSKNPNPGLKMYAGPPPAANTGTPTIIPGTPNKPPPTMIATITIKLDSPVDSPRIFGPRIFPSNC